MQRDNEKASEVICINCFPNTKHGWQFRSIYVEWKMVLITFIWQLIRICKRKLCELSDIMLSAFYIALCRIVQCVTKNKRHQL